VNDPDGSRPLNQDEAQGDSIELPTNTEHGKKDDQSDIVQPGLS
jgi:hypothetical protein